MDRQFEDVDREIDDVVWYFKLGDAAKIAKYRISTSKPLRMRNATGQGAGNSLIMPVYVFTPKGVKGRAPLVVFIHGGFWTLSDDEYQIGPAVAEALLPNGIAVGLVRYRLAPAAAHPAQAQDVAAAIAHLIRSADKYGFDAKRVYLAGHSAGAHLAALVALDGSYLRAQRLSPRSLAGVVGFSGIYDLRRSAESAEQQKLAVRQAFGDNPDKLTAASPTTHPRADAPPFLILGAENDFPGFLIDAKRFADSLRKTGHKQAEQFILPDHDHFSLVQLIDRDPELRSLLLEFFKVQPLPREVAVLIEARRRWMSPPLSTAPFWR
ncbi:MAG: alpha/beta hydrolase, partial [Gammaproteobacteria bacterium]